MGLATTVSPSPLKWGLTWLAVFLSVGVFSYAFFAGLSYQFDWSTILEYRHRNRLLQGWWVTLLVSLASLVLSTFLGLLVMFGQRAPILFVRCLSRFYVEVVRGTPLIVQILFGYYVIFERLRLDDPFWAGILIISGFSAAYLSEIFRAGIESIPRSQVDSARAIGLSTRQTYLHVIFPQAIRQVLPAFAGQSASLIKDTSLLFAIAVNEFTFNARKVNSETFSPFETFLPLALGYLVLTLPISWWARAMERKTAFEK
jgi:polar amino acid transport system permease protein